MRRNSAGLPLALVNLVLAQGCAQAPPPAAPPVHNSEPVIVSEWLPLENDTVSDFDTAVEGTGERGRLVMQVSRPHPNQVELNVAGKIRRLTVKPEGVEIATGGWLLKRPFTVGATFPGLNGHVTVVSVDKVLDVPAGHFTGCIETEEKTATNRTITDFCRGSGIARLVIEGSADGELRREIAELRFYGPRVDVGPEKTTATPESVKDP